jgi:hypothetical protein
MIEFLAVVGALALAYLAIRGVVALFWWWAKRP